MRAIYIDRYFMRDNHDCYFASISLPILERKHIKAQLKSICNKVLDFDNLNYLNVKEYYGYCNFFVKNINMSSFVLRVKRYRRSEYCKELFKIIEHQYSLYNEPLRVYIPYDKNKNYLKTINKMVKKRGMNVSVEEIRFEESSFSQLANIIAGCIYYHDREDLYERNIGKKGKPQLIAYLYSCKKPKNKLIIKDYKTML